MLSKEAQLVPQQLIESETGVPRLLGCLPNVFAVSVCYVVRGMAMATRTELLVAVQVFKVKSGATGHGSGSGD